MTERKYVVLQDFDTGKEYAVIFDRDLSHKAVAEGIDRGMSRNEWGPRMSLDPVAAGFVTDELAVDLGRVSESLGLGPRQVDQQLIRSDVQPRPAPINSAPRRSVLERAKGARGRP